MFWTRNEDLGLIWFRGCEIRMWIVDPGLDGHKWSLGKEKKINFLVYRSSTRLKDFLMFLLSRDPVTDFVNPDLRLKLKLKYYTVL
jgi:hypothetical protein